MKVQNSTYQLPEAKLRTIRELFSDRKSYKIPAYQRPYDWSNSHREALIKDIERLAKLLSTDNNATHFCGTITCTPSNIEPNQYSVVDGQQRITSLVLMHARVCKHLGMNSFIMTGGEESFHPQPVDSLAFSAVTTGSPKTSNTTAAQDNYLSAAKQFDQWLDDTTTKTETLLDIIENKISVILFTLPDDGEVAKVFETINNRGKPLNQLDLVKNHLVYITAIRKWNAPNINEVWNEIQRISWEIKLSDSDADMVLRATVIAQFKPGRRDVGETDFKIVSDRLQEDSVDYGEFNKFVHFLLENFKTYKMLRSANDTDPTHPKMRVLTHLNYHDSITGVLPLVFARQFLRSDEGMDAPVLEAIEKANFRLYGLPNRAARSDSFNVRLHKLAHDYFNGNTSDEAIIAELTSLVEGVQKNGFLAIVESLTLDDSEDYDYYNWPWRRYFLARYEESLLDRQSFNFSRLSTPYSKSKRTNDFLSVEHIWPQKADDTSVRDYKDGLQIKRLGNLMLLPHGVNITLSNNTIEVKLKAMSGAEVTRLRQNEILEDIALKARQFVELLRDRKNEKFGEVKERFNSGTIEKNQMVALVKTICDLREEDMIRFAIKEWRMKGEKASEYQFLGVFSFAHSEEAFCSDRERAKNKNPNNYVVRVAGAEDSDHAKRLLARNEVIGEGSVIEEWKA